MSAVRALVRKELRALLPMWAACGAAFVLASRFETRYIPDLASILFVFSCLALGAQSMGHEYAHRTVGLLLTQPIERRRALVIKTGVLAALLVAFGAAAFFALVEDTTAIEELAITPIQALTITILAALFVTPYLTMVCRSGMAGFVFTGSVVFMLGMNITFAFSRWLGDGNGSAIHPAFWWPGMLIVSALGAMGSWRLGARLEVTDFGRRSIRLPFVSRWGGRDTAVAPASRHPVMWLLGKELRLQQMSFGLAAVWAVCLGVLYARGQFEPRYLDGMLPLAFMAMGTLPLVIGSIASAEERQLGTLEWQQLLPLGMEQQWMVKGGVVIGLSLLLGIGIPAVSLGAVNEGGQIGDWIAVALLVLVITSTALYVSSLATSAIRAVVIAVCVLTAASVTIPWLTFAVLRDLRLPTTGLGLPVPAALSILALPLLYFGSRNHASAERPVDQLRRQIPWLALTLILSLLAVA